MSEGIVQGLSISIAGITLTFAALGLLILAIVLLTRLIPAHDKRKTTSSKLVEPRMAEISGPSSGDDEVVAVIATAVAHLLATDAGRCRSTTGS